jgi:hypothetical protein
MRALPASESRCGGGPRGKADFSGSALWMNSGARGHRKRKGNANRLSHRHPTRSPSRLGTPSPPGTKARLPGPGYWPGSGMQIGVKPGCGRSIRVGQGGTQQAKRGKSGLSTHRSIFFIWPLSGAFFGFASSFAGAYQRGAAAMLESLMFILRSGEVLLKHLAKLWRTREGRHRGELHIGNFFMNLSKRGKPPAAHPQALPFGSAGRAQRADSAHSRERAAGMADHLHRNPQVGRLRQVRAAARRFSPPFLVTVSRALA